MGRRLLALAALLGFTVTAPIASAAMLTIPFLYEDARIYVPVRIGGGEARWFILDSGATGTIIDQAVAEQARLKVTGGEVVHGAGAGGSLQSRTGALSLRIGGVPLKVSEPAVMDLVHLLGPTSGRAPAGIIGSQFFREHFVGIDFVSRSLTIDPPKEARRRYAASVPLDFADWTPLTNVKLTLPDGTAVTAHALVDLGAKSTFLLPEPFIAKTHLRQRLPKTVITAFGAGVGGDTYYAFGRARSLSLASAPEMRLDHPIVGLSVNGTLRSDWHQGLLGAEFLSRFRLGFDYAHRRLLLAPAMQQPVRFDASGLFLVAGGPRLETIVVREVEDGPGKLAGIKVGDELIAIDGRPVEKFRLAGVRERLKEAGRTVTIAFLRQGQQRTASLALRSLL